MAQKKALVERETQFESIKSACRDLNRRKGAGRLIYFIVFKLIKFLQI